MRVLTQAVKEHEDVQLVKEESKISRSEFELRDDGRGRGGKFRERLG